MLQKAFKTLITVSLVSQLARIGVAHYLEDMSVIGVLNQSVPPSHGMRKGVKGCMFVHTCTGRDIASYL